MKRTAFLTAGIAAGFLLLAPGMALAATEPTGTPTTTLSAPGPVKHDPTRVVVKPAKGAPGAKIVVDTYCDGGHYVSSPAMTITKDQFVVGTDILRYDGVVKNVSPGMYKVNIRCHHYDDNSDRYASGSFTVLPKQAPAPAKQVAKVPAGAPQTGGTDGPVAAETSVSNPAPAVAMGALALGGIGLTAAQRRRSRRRQG